MRGIGGNVADCDELDLSWRPLLRAVQDTEHSNFLTIV
jgi:hypothetical protein